MIARHRPEVPATRNAAQLVTVPTEILGKPQADLLFGYRQGDGFAEFLSDDDFQREWRSPARVCVVCDRRFEVPGAVVLQDGARERLIRNRAS